MNSKQLTELVQEPQKQRSDTTQIRTGRVEDAVRPGYHRAEGAGREVSTYKKVMAPRRRLGGLGKMDKFIRDDPQSTLIVFGMIFTLCDSCCLKAQLIWTEARAISTGPTSSRVPEESPGARGKGVATMWK